MKSADRRVQQNSTADEEVINSIRDNKVTPDSALISKIRQKRIIQAIDSLKPKFKEVIMLSEIEGYTYEQIAEKLQVPIGTVKSRIYNAKQELAQQLEDLL